MGKSHIKRVSAPKSWPISRRSTKWVIRCNPGPHSLEDSMPIGVFIKEILNYVSNTKETKFILNEGQVMVNGKVRKDQKFQAGIMDVLSIGKDNYRIIINKKGQIVPIKIKEDEAKICLKQVINRKTLKGNKIQVNFKDGTNLLSKEKYHKGDTVVFVDGKIKEHIKIGKGVSIYILGGKKVGCHGIVKEIINNNGLQEPKIIFAQGEEEFETLQKYAFVIGKEKPIIALSNE